MRRKVSGSHDATNSTVYSTASVSVGSDDAITRLVWNKIVLPVVCRHPHSAPLAVSEGQRPVRLAATLHHTMPP
jgi:hypothetical protein